MKKETHEQYVKKLTVKNPTVEVVGKYIDAKTYILHHCLIHDVYWETAPYRVLSGCGCKQCRIDKFKKSNTKTHEQYVKEVAKINTNIEVIGQYITAKEPMLHKCKIDGYEWNTAPSSVLRGHGCPKCRDRLLYKQKAKTQKQYESDVKQVHSTIMVLGEYVNAETAILHKCTLDGHEWLAKPGNILNGKGCPKCAGNLQLTHEEYVEKLFNVNPNIKPIGQYINAKTKIWHQCLIDGYLWEVEPSSVLQGCGCPKCAGNIQKTHREYVIELEAVNKDIEVIGKYINSNIPILHRCKIDGYEWSITPSNVLNGQGCPRCKESNGERVVRQCLESHNILYKYQYKFDDCGDKKSFPFDFYLVKYNLCIEVDGIQHYKPVDFAGKGKEWAEQQFKEVQVHDKIKTEYCKNNNIRLLRIPYFKNINEILNNYLLNIVT